MSPIDLTLRSVVSSRRVGCPPRAAPRLRSRYRARMSSVGIRSSSTHGMFDSVGDVPKTEPEIAEAENQSLLSRIGPDECPGVFYSKTNRQVREGGCVDSSSEETESSISVTKVPPSVQKRSRFMDQRAPGIRKVKDISPRHSASRPTSKRNSIRL